MVSRQISPFVLCILTAASAFGQTAAGFGAISGAVRDASGAAIPNAKVTVSNPGKGIVRNLATNEAGVFTAPALVPASGYSVAVTAPGFAPWDVKDVQLLVGQNVNLNISLLVAASTTQVEVTATAPLVEDTKTDVSQVIGSREILELPINGRRVDSFVLLSPGVSNDGTFGNLTFRGMAGAASFLVDGVDNTEQYFNENGGRTRVGSQISQDAVQEFQVVSSNFTAEYGRASGGVVNTVTRSGSNDLHGTAFWFFRNRTLNARDRYASFNPPEVRHQAGASVGGAIRKDKLFYFLNIEIQRRNFPLASSINRPAVIDFSGSFVGCGAPATPAQCSAINSLLPRFFGTLPRDANQELAFAKLDWRPTERNAFSASFNFLHFITHNGIQTASTLNTGAGIYSNGDDSVRLRNGRLSWTGIVSNNAVNEARIGWFTDRQADDIHAGVQTAGLGYLSYSVAGQSLGAGASYLPRVNPNEQRFQFTDNYSWTLGKHSAKFGFDIANSQDYVFNMSNWAGSYTYGSVTAFAQDFSGNTTGAKNWQSYAQTLGTPSVDFTIRDHGFYAQDQFHVTPKLTVNYGVRYEYAALPQPSITNPDYPQTGRIHSSKKNFAPRLGLAYRLTDKTVLRAGWGIYHARYSGVLISSLFTNNAVYQKALSLTSANYSVGPVFPNILQSSDLAKAGSTVEFAAPDLRTPYTEQGTVAVERELTRGLGLTVSYLWNRGIQGLGVRDLNIGPLGPLVTYQIGDANGNIVGAYSTPTYLLANRVNKNFSRVLQTENGINSYYNALVVQVRKQYSHGFQGALSYTWAHEIDYKQGTYQDNYGFSTIDSFANTWNGDYKADKGSGLLDQRHRMIINFVESPVFVRRSGAFYKYAVNNWQLAGIVTLAAGRPVTAFSQVSDTTPFPGAAFTSTLNGFGGNNRVPFWPTAPLYTPPTYRGDVRLSKILPLSERYRVYLNFEAFNVTNTVVDTSLNGQAFTLRGGVLSPTPGLGVGRASAGFPDGTNARRAQVSARFVF
jgi:outer membrane receptor protein involved in Fe transport